MLTKSSNRQDPEEFLSDNIEGNKEIVSNHVGLEVDLVDLLHTIGHGLKFIDLVEYEQGPEMPCPEGRLFCTFTKRVPGENFDEIRDQLSPEDLCAIRVQRTEILNEMGKAKRVMNEEHLSFFRYDREHKSCMYTR